MPDYMTTRSGRNGLDVEKLQFSPLWRVHWTQYCLSVDSLNWSWRSHWAARLPIIFLLTCC